MKIVRHIYGPKDFSVGQVQEMLITLGKCGFTPEMANIIANAKSGKADEVINLFSVPKQVDFYNLQIV